MAIAARRGSLRRRAMAVASVQDRVRVVSIRRFGTFAAVRKVHGLVAKASVRRHPEMKPAVVPKLIDEALVPVARPRVAGKTIVEALRVAVRKVVVPKLVLRRVAPKGNAVVRVARHLVVAKMIAAAPKAIVALKDVALKAAARKLAHRGDPRVIVVAPVVHRRVVPREIAVPRVAARKVVVQKLDLRHVTMAQDAARVAGGRRPGMKT